MEEKVLGKVKLRLEIDNDDADDLINEYIEEIRFRIIHYLNIDYIPEELINVWCSIVIDLICETQKSSEDIFGNNAGEYDGIKSISEGDLNISFSQSHPGDFFGSEQNIDSIFNDYLVDLHHYRQMRS